MTYKNWKIFKLGDLCEFSSEKIETKYISNKNYISTENMLPNKQGVTIASSLPKTKKVNKFEKDDVLISNIRPYFKKIWFANMNGGASNDVLILKNKNKEILDNQYLFYFLSTDHFFNYVTSSAKGTKMPRGDKTAIMKYEILLPPIEDQKKIAAILSTIDKKIKINNKINKTIANIANTIFKYWFIDFEFPNENGEPYKSSGGEMIESELGKIPKKWDILKLGYLGEFKNGINYSRNEDGDKEYSIINVRDLVEGDFIIKNQLDKIRINSNKAESYKLLKGDLLIVRSANPGEMGIVLEDLENTIYSGFIIRFRLTEDSLLYYTYFALKSKKNKFAQYSDGTTLKNINQKMLKKINVIIPEKKVLEKFNQIVQPIFNKITLTNKENEYLKELRDLLLPKLMSGEIRVPIESE